MTQARTSDFETLQQQLLAEHQALLDLQTTLLQEKDCLAENKIDELTRLTEQKANLVNRISELVEQRSEHLQSLGLENTAEDMQALISKAPGNTLEEGLSQAWEQNIALLEECQRQNEINGIVIEVGNQATRLMLDLLQGPNKETATTYNKKGKTSQSNGKPPLAKA